MNVISGRFSSCTSQLTNLYREIRMVTSSEVILISVSSQASVKVHDSHIWADNSLIVAEIMFKDQYINKFSGRCISVHVGKKKRKKAYWMWPIFDIVNVVKNVAQFVKKPNLTYNYTKIFRFRQKWMSFPVISHHARHN